SVIGLGTERDQDAELLKDIAKRGKGRIFFTDKPDELPRLFAQDTFVVARNTFIDEPVRVRLTAGLSTLTDQPLPAPGNLADGVNFVQLHLDPERKGESFAGLPRIATLRSLANEAPRVERGNLRWSGADTLSVEVPLDGGETTLTTVEVPGYDAVPLPPVCLP